MRLSARVCERLRCPVCGGLLLEEGEGLTCTAAACRRAFPCLDGVPVLLDDDVSLFSIADYRHGTARIVDPPRSRFRRAVARLLPPISANVAAEDCFVRLRDELLASSEHPIVLIVGGSLEGGGIEHLLAHPAIECIDSDVAPGPRTELICDGHHLPFADGSLDGVVVQAVLEHVLDPWRCVQEIHRVLRPNGLVYCEVPFMQQVHLGAYDFTRFTHGGLRRLFRDFSELDSGVACGPGMALAWAWEHFLLSFTASVFAQRLARLAARFTGFWLPYCDRYLRRQPGALDAASAYHFTGRRSDRRLEDRVLIGRYQGLQRSVTRPRI